MRKNAVIAIGAIFVLTLTACAGGGSGSDGSADSTELNIYAWPGHVANGVIAAFEEETGVSVTVDTFDSNETMISKLAVGNSGYDIVEPAQYAVQLLVGQGLVEPIDYDRIDGMENIQDTFIDPTFDPDNAHSVPWVWGSTGLLYNIDCTGEELTSWDALFDEKYAGKMYMLDNMLSSYVVGLQINGYGADSTDEAEIEKATETLRAQKPLLAGYNSTNYFDLVSSGDACLSLAWGGSPVAAALAANPSLRYILPEEGGTLWTDGFSIAKDAAHENAAYMWLNFTLRPEIAAMVTNEGSLATTNEAALKLVTDAEVLENPAIFAPADQLADADFVLDPGEAMRFFQDGWTRVKAS